MSASRHFVPVTRNSCRSSVYDILLKFENLSVIVTGRKQILSVTHKIVPDSDWWPAVISCTDLTVIFIMLNNKKYVAFSGKTHNAQIDILSDLSGNKTIALRLRSLLIVPLNSWGDIWSLRAWMYYLYIHSLIGSIAHTDLIQRNWAVISTQARDYLPLLLLYNAKLPLNLAIKSPRYAFSQRELHIYPWI